MTNKNNKNKLLDIFRQKCRKNKISLTPQRVEIYTVLSKSHDHPSAEDIYERVKKTFPDISVYTVYRTLTTFSDIGLIDVVEGYGQPKRYDIDTNTHHHFRCKSCNTIIDFQDRNYAKLKAPQKIQKKYHVTNIKVVVEGLCDKCEK